MAMTDIVSRIEGLSTTGLVSSEPHYLNKAFEAFPKELRDKLWTGVQDFGKHAIYRFPNGYGASLVTCSLLTMGAPVELAVLRWQGDDYSMQGDPLRCSIEDANKVLGTIAAQPAPLFGILPANCNSRIPEA